jgi:hypothetical protein
LIETLASAPALRLRPLWTALGWSFVGLVVYLSLTSDPPDLGVRHAFAVGHVVAYFWLMIWFAQLHHAARMRALLAAGFFALGAVLEWIQGLTGYRMFDYADMAANGLGIVIAFGLARTRLQHTLLAVERLLARR